MALVFKDRVTDTTTTTGTGSLALAGAPPTGYQAFSAVGNGNTCYYTVVDRSTGAWESGLGTYSSTGPTLARTSVLASSNGGAAVSFAAGTKDVALALSASYLASLAALSLPQFASTIGVGAAASASGSGVSFPATQAASTDPNTLDDYVEGTWTPTVSPNTGTGFTYTSSGRYTKVGNKVTASFTVSVTANGTGAGYIKVSLPPVFGTPIHFAVAFGSEYGTTGIILQSTTAIGGTTFNVQTATGGYPVVTGSVFTCTTIYFV